MFTRRTVLNSLVAGGALGLLGSSSTALRGSGRGPAFPNLGRPPASSFGAGRHPRSADGSADPMRRSFGNRAAHPVPRLFGRPASHPDQLREENNRVMRAVRRFPERAYGSVYLSPSFLDFSLQEFDRCVRDGPMVGVGELEADKRCNAPELDPIVERAISMKAPILQHTWLKLDGNLPGESTPYDLVELARRHPDANFICAHTGGDWERGIRIIRNTKNICGWKSQDSIPRPVSWRWRFANSVPNEWCTAATSAAEASPRNSPRLWAPIFRIPPRNWCSAGICAGCSHPPCERKDTRRDHRHQRQSLALAVSPPAGRRDSGPGGAAAQAECGAGLGGKFRRDSAQGYRRRERPAGGGLRHPRQRLAGAFRVDQSEASRLAGGCAAMREGLQDARHTAASQLPRI